MKTHIILLMLILTNLAVFGQSGDNTAPLSIRQLANGRIQVSFTSSVNRPNMTAVNFIIELPANVTITAPVYYLNVAPVPGGAQTEFGHSNFTAGPFISNVEYPLMDFAWISTNPPGSFGSFNIQNDDFNYIELGGGDRSGPALNNAMNIPLPIKLRSFSAVKDGERASRLDWISSSEINSDYFGIERSQDGSNWENIGQVQAAGDSNEDIAYQYIDRKLPNFRNGNNIFYYRLKMTDLDGKFKYSDVRGVNFGKSSESTFSVYPNPTTQLVNVDLSGLDLADGEVTLAVYDMNGRNLINKSILGNGIELIEMQQYPAGTYNVVVQQGDNLQQKKIIKID